MKSSDSKDKEPFLRMMTNADGSADLYFGKEAPAVLESTAWFCGEIL